MNNRYDIGIMKEIARDNGFELLNNTYKDVKAIAILKCLNCGEIKEVRFAQLIKGTKCSSCKPRGNRLTYEYVKNYVEIESKSGCELLETEKSYYDKCKKNPKMVECKLSFKCSICKKEFYQSFNSFKSSKKYRCNKCSAESAGKIQAHTYEEVKKYIEVDSGSGCKLISSNYVKYHDKLKLQCSCGNVFERALSEFKGRKLYKCPECTGAKIKFKYEDIKNDLLSHNIILLEDVYKSNMTNMKIKYSCGFIAYRNYENIRKSNYVCPHCNKKGYGRNTEVIRRELQEITNGEYSLLSEYRTMNDKIKIIHNNCGNIYEVTPHNFIDGGNRCPFCNITKGERKILDILENNKLNYIYQYEFDDLLSNKGFPLKFDFAVFINNEVILIEYDGEFHYMEVYEGHDFEGQKERDELKNQYCKKNNLRLIRIPYWEFDNINEILIKEELYAKKNI